MSEKYILSENGTVIEFRLVVKTMFTNDDHCYYSENEREREFKKLQYNRKILLSQKYNRDSNQTPKELELI